MGRLRSRSPTGSPHRNSKAAGNGGDDGSAEGTLKFTCRLADIHVIIGMFSNVQLAKL